MSKVRNEVMQVTYTHVLFLHVEGARAPALIVSMDQGSWSAIHYQFFYMERGYGIDLYFIALDCHEPISVVTIH
jgi:hypothetical protein